MGICVLLQCVQSAQKIKCYITFLYFSVYSNQRMVKDDDDDDIEFAITSTHTHTQHLDNGVSKRNCIHI